MSFKPQRLTWWCGLAAASAALKCLGIDRDQEELATLCHVTKKHGTNEQELMRALLACDVRVAPWDSRRQRVSMQWLQSTLIDHGPAVLCLDRHGHWGTVIGSLTQTTFWLFDPAADAGLQRYGYDELASRWRYSAVRPNYYGIGVAP